MGEMWVCGYCGEENGDNRSTCSLCFKTKSNNRLCPSCSTENHPSKKYCRSCGAKLTDEKIGTQRKDSSVESVSSLLPQNNTVQTNEDKVTEPDPEVHSQTNTGITNQASTEENETRYENEIDKKRISLPIALGFSVFVAFLVSLAFWTYFRYGIYSYGMSDRLSFSKDTMFVYLLNGAGTFVITLIRHKRGQIKTILDAIITGLVISILFLGITLSGCRFLVSTIP